MAEFHNTLILRKNSKHSKKLENIFQIDRGLDVDFKKHLNTIKEVAVIGANEIEPYILFNFDSGGEEIEDSVIFELMENLRLSDCKTAYGHIWADELGECLISIKSGILEVIKFNEESDPASKITRKKSEWKDKGFHLYSLIDEEFDEEVKKYKNKRKKNRTSYEHEELVEILNMLMDASNDEQLIDRKLKKLSEWEINLYFRILICQYFENPEKQNSLMLQMIDSGRIDMETRIFFWKAWEDPDSAPPLFWAMYHGHVHVVEKMIEMNAPFVQPNKRNARNMKDHIRHISRDLDDYWKKYVNFEKCMSVLDVDLDSILDA